MPHTLCGAPALEAEGALMPVMVTVDELGAQGLFEIVHSNTFAPSPNPVTPELLAVGVVMVPLPLTSDHTPVPSTGTLPFRVAVVPHMFCAAPALEAVGDATPVTVTCEELAVQGGLEIVH